MPGLARQAIPAAIAGGSLLFGDDAEAGFLTPGIRGARDKINYDPSARGNSTLKLGLANAPDGSGMSTNDRLDTLLSAMEGMGKKKQLQYFTNYIHNKANYEAWGGEMLAKDGQRSGQAYKDGLDAFLEDITERRPQLEPVVTEYAMAGGGRGRLSRSSEQAQRQEDNRRRFKHGASSRPIRRRAVAEPSLLDIQVDEHNAAVARDLDNLGLTADPMYDYGTLLPIKQDITTGETSLAAPDILRTVVGGLLSLGNTPKTGVYDPNALLDVAL